MTYANFLSSWQNEPLFAFLVSLVLIRYVLGKSDLRREGAFAWHSHVVFVVGIAIGIYGFQDGDRVLTYMSIAAIFYFVFMQIVLRRLKYT